MRRAHCACIDWAAFAADFKAELDRSKLSLRELRKMIGVHNSTLSRAANGTRCTAEVYMALCLWMRVSPTRFYRSDMPSR